jgi:hypothetical protein
MGINVGDIIRDGRDIYGDGVNVAGRLERVRCRLSAGGKEIRTLGPPVEDGAWTASAELREVPAGQLRFAPDSPLEGSGFEPSVPLAGPTSDSQSAPIETPPREEDL